MGDSSKIIPLRRIFRDPPDDGYDDLVATIRGASVPQIVSLLAAAHDDEVLAAIATELGELVDHCGEANGREQQD